MDVNYIKKSKDKKYQLEYHLRNDSMEYFTDEMINNGELKNFIQNVSSFNLHYEIKIDYTRYEDFQTSCFIW